MSFKFGGAIDGIGIMIAIPLAVIAFFVFGIIGVFAMIGPWALAVNYSYWWLLLYPLMGAIIGGFSSE